VTNLHRLGRSRLIGLLVVGVVIAGAAVGVLRPPSGQSRIGDAERITASGMRTDLEALAAIATANAGTRALGTDGYAASAAYVEAALRAVGWTVSADTFDAPVFLDPGGSRLEIPAGPSFGRGDVAPLIYAPAGLVTARIVVLNWDPADPSPTGRGCSARDYPPESAGAIVAVRNGPCYRRDQVIAAQEAGAVGFVALNAAFGPGEVRRSTLIRPDGLRIPALAGSRTVGNALAAIAAARQPAGTDGRPAMVTLVTTGTTGIRPTRSILAELPGTEPGRVVMLGAHLDSVLDGAGVDDDGSGVAALLALSRAAAAGPRARATLRLAFWSGEEVGLLGSGRYVAGLDANERSRILAYLNADMLGSPNGFPGVYAEADAPPGSAALTADLQAALEDLGSASVAVELGGGSDHAPFMQGGIPVGGVFSGALEPVTAPQAAASGSTFGLPPDPCYHLVCDGPANVDVDRATTLARALCLVALRLADDPGRLGGG